MTQVKYELGEHNSKAVIFIRFEYSSALNERVKKLVGVKWSNSKKSWYVLDTQKFGIVVKIHAGKEVLAHIHDINKPALSRLIETLHIAKQP